MPTKNVNCIAIQYGALNSTENAISTGWAKLNEATVHFCL